MSDELDDLLREITFEPPDHLEAPPWPAEARRRRRWPLAAAILLAAAAAAVLAVGQRPPVPAEPASAASWPAVALDDQLRWLSETDAVAGPEPLASHAAPMCPPPGAVITPYCTGLR